MMPLWMYTLGSTIPADEEVGKITIPFLSIVGSLAALIVPLIVGVTIKYKLPRLSKLIKKYLKASLNQWLIKRPLHAHCLVS